MLADSLIRQREGELSLESLVVIKDNEVSTPFFWSGEGFDISAHVYVCAIHDIGDEN